MMGHCGMTRGMTVTSLSDKPDVCEVTISLSDDVKRNNIQVPVVEGLYKEDGSYYHGRPVLQQEGGHFTLSVYWAWMVNW